MTNNENRQQDNKYFNLLDEPWILVRNKQGKVEELSIIDTFSRAHELDCLDGELPTQDVAILRFLLAILYAVFTRVDECGQPSILAELNDEEQRKEALRRWKALWDAPELPMEPIKQYLEYYRDRFWLVHPTWPFYQIAGLKSSNETKDTSQMISDVPPRAERRFITLRSGIGATQLNCSEAVRWLITLQAWDYAGKKAVTTDLFGNRGSENGGGSGWLGKLGVLYINTPDFIKTLLMNLVLLDSTGVLLEFGQPIWEEDQRNALKLEKQPNGFVGLLTYQSRRVCLFVQQGTVKGVTISYGDVFEKENAFIEQMSSWHLSSQSKETPIFIPTTHKTGRSLWRDLASLLPQTIDSDKEVLAGVINWGQMLKYNNFIENDRFTISAVGIEYGPMQGVVNEIVADSITINAELLLQLNNNWVYRIVIALKKTDDCIHQLGWLAQQFAQASGSSDGSSGKSSAYALAYHTFDGYFRNWLSSINPVTDNLDSRILEWQDTTSRIIKELGFNLYETLNTQAIIGRIDQQNSRIIAAPVAFMNFRRSINKILENWKEETTND